MFFQRSIFVAVFVLSPFLSNAQKSLDSLFTELRDVVHERLQNVWTKRVNMDSVHDVIRAKRNEIFSHPDICSYIPGASLATVRMDRLIGMDSGITIAYSLMNHVVIASSPDSLVRFYSWDDLDGGNWHYYTSYLTYQDAEKGCQVQVVDTLMEAPIEVGYYEVQQFEDGNRMIYLASGFGSSGGGEQHIAIKLFESEEGVISECLTCYSEEGEMYIPMSQISEIYVEFDAETKEITYMKPLEDDFLYSLTDFNKVKLRFIDGRFVRF